MHASTCQDKRLKKCIPVHFYGIKDTTDWVEIKLLKVIKDLSAIKLLHDFHTFLFQKLKVYKDWLLVFSWGYVSSRLNASLSETQLCGADLAAVDVNTLDTLHITTPEEREQLLSAIYNELHPPTTITQRLDSLLGTLFFLYKATFISTVCKIVLLGSLSVYRIFRSKWYRHVHSDISVHEQV